MSEYNSIPLTKLAATIADAIGIERPAQSDTPIDWVNLLLREYCKDSYDRVLMHNADAVGMWLLNKYPEMFEPVLKHTMLSLPLLTAYPSYTPVCFATMYTGASPETHGLQKRGYKPVVKIDTLFDSLIRSKKRVAILGVTTSSMVNIFRDRDIDFYIYPNEMEAKVEEKAHELIKEDKHDFICVYTYEYDKTDHQFGPEAPESLSALKGQIDIFDRLVVSIRENWKDRNTLISFAPDHGVHLSLETPERPGAHGTDNPLDMNIIHYIGVVSKSQI